MSWLTAIPPSSDVFDEDTDELSLQNKEWRSSMEKRVQDGFRDGIDAGKEASLQQGFNLGYREGAAQMRTIGQLKGIVSALQCWCPLHPSVSSESITHLLQKVEKHEERILAAMRSAQENPPTSVSELVGDLDELSVDQRDSGSSDCDRIEAGINEHCQEGQRDCCGHKSSNGMYSEKLFVKEDGVDWLLSECLELVNELGLPEELRLYIQQLRHP